MRTITKAEPRELSEWRARNQGGPTFSYDQMRLDHEVVDAVLAALHREQGGLDAYTGQRIYLGRRDPATGHRSGDTFHIEHLLPQKHCTRGEDVAYHNMVACLPAPNTPRLPYGAHEKDEWPSRAELPDFVSPLSARCEERFKFKLNGTVGPASPTDRAVQVTIEKLALNRSSTLVRFRKEAIDRTLQHGALSIAQAQKRLAVLASATGVLEPFSFVLRQALEKHIGRIRAIRASKRASG
ncbi:MAG TPA: hypothetical protein VEY93_13155 [Longimicrobium sp.]|nr:hypothetical protein [Longimicrobium sp.]